MLDVLCSAATDRGSRYYSPGYVNFMNWIDARKRNYVAWLVRHADGAELGDWHGLSRAEKQERGGEFLVRHSIFDMRRRSVSLPAKVTKQYLLGGYRRVLNGKSKPGLVREYNAVTGGSAEQHEEGNVQVQKMLF